MTKAKSTRLKTPATSQPKPEPIASLAELHQTLDDIIKRQLALNELRLKRDKAVQFVLDSHDPEIVRQDATIAVDLKRCEAYVSEHKDDVGEDALFTKGKKSAETTLALFGLRTNPPSLKCLKGWTFDRVISELSKTRRKAYVVVKESLDKHSILTKVRRSKLASLGLKVVQEDEFWVKSKTDELSNK